MTSSSSRSAQDLPPTLFSWDLLRTISAGLGRAGAGALETRAAEKGWESSVGLSVHGFGENSCCTITHEHLHCRSRNQRSN